MAGGDMVTAKAKKPQSQTVFVATTMSKNTRRRPVVMRRKSSKSGTTQSALGHSPEVSSPLAGEGWVDFDEGDEDGNEDTLSPLKESAAHDKGSVTPTPKSSARQTQLPESFIATLKAELKAHPPQKPSQPRNLKLSVDPKTNPQANDPDLWYGWYRQPSKDKLIDEPFRKKFAEQVQDAKIAAAQVVETGEFLDEVVTKAEDSYYLTQTPSYTPVHSFRGNTNTNILTPDSSGSCAILTTSSSAETQFLGSGPTPRSSGPVSGASLIPTPSSGSNDATISVSGLSTFRNVGVGVGMGPDVDGNGDGDGEAPQEGNPGSGLKMDVTFEELEELCPMVW
ncbi:hypothetical protein PHISCL_08785 [Aspergillus sclerotialis]|uniref:Uncharacterized protein n=1 Tax=Aspergillus sclerotialis TaxID=2070753 RepID=A0A3A2ZHT3_9EURO|nr:hypothetical protein PHISCL_08785 [Aspergillus sclerotialis]